jgi:pimeloyl-ACP methyl ester carboxylesterase
MSSRSLLVLLPGLLCDARAFAGPLRRLQALRPAQQVIVPRIDLHASITAAAEEVLRTVSAAAAPSSSPPLSVAVAGFSFGGYIALEMARLLQQQHQQRGSAPPLPFSLDRLALLSSQAREDTPAHTERRLAQIAQARRDGRLDAVLAQQARVLFHPSVLPADGDLDRLVAREAAAAAAVTPSTVQLLDPFSTFVHMGAETGVDGFEREQRAIMSRVDTRDALASFCRGAAATASAAPLRRRRVLVLAGRDDRLLPPKVHIDLKALCEEAAGAAASGAAAGADVRLVLLSDCGHMSPLEKPVEVGDALAEWLRE